MNTKQLKNKILDLAIRGQLVEQDPSDEPAQVLLERIINEKSSMVTDKKKKKTTHKNPYQNEEEFPFEIPQNWAWCRLGEIGISDLGKTLNSNTDTGELTPYLCSINVHWSGINLTEIKKAKFSESDLEKYNVIKNDLLICEGGDFGRCTIWDIETPMYYQNALHRVRFYGNISPYFFKFCIEYYKNINYIDNYAKGVTIKHLTKSALHSIPFPLPPLSEQRRIVSKIEEIFALIDELEINKTDLQTLIKQTKTKVLDLAIRGKLLNDENTLSFEEATSDNGHYNDFPFPIPKHWQWKKLGEVFKIIMGQSPKGENVSESGKMEFHQGKIFFTSKYLNLSNIYTNQVTKIAPANSVLLCVRAPVGEVNITKREICIGRGLCSIVPQDKMSSKFVYYWLLTLKENFERKATGSTFASISMDIIKNEKIPLPPLSEQEKIVQKIEKIFSELEKIETIINH